MYTLWWVVYIVIYKCRSDVWWLGSVVYVYVHETWKKVWYKKIVVTPPTHSLLDSIGRHVFVKRSQADRMFVEPASQYYIQLWHGMIACISMPDLCTNCTWIWILFVVSKYTWSSQANANAFCYKEGNMENMLIYDADWVMMRFLRSVISSPWFMCGFSRN